MINKKIIWGVLLWVVLVFQVFSIVFICTGGVSVVVLSILAIEGVILASIGLVNAYADYVKKQTEKELSSLGGIKKQSFINEGYEIEVYYNHKFKKFVAKYTNPTPICTLGGTIKKAVNECTKRIKEWEEKRKDTEGA